MSSDTNLGNVVEWNLLEQYDFIVISHIEYCNSQEDLKHLYKYIYIVNLYVNFFPDTRLF